MDAVIEIKHFTIRSNKYGGVYCSSKCQVGACKCPMATKRGVDYLPTDKCPGPGRYRLVRVEDGNE